MPVLSTKSWSLPDVRIRPGLYLPQCLLGVGLYGIAALCLWSCAMPWPLCLLLSALALYYTVGELSRLNRCWGRLPLASLVCENGKWQMQLQTGEWYPLQLEPWPLVHPGVVVARFIVPGGGDARFSLLLIAGNTDPELWRRLSLCLRYGREPC